MRFAWPLLLACVACAEEATDPPADVGSATDARPNDAATDGGPRDGSSSDADLDAGTDAASLDGTIADANDPDTGPGDSGAEIVVVVGYGGRRVMSRDGISWEHFQELTANGGDDNDLFRGVTYGNGTFVAVGGSSNAYTMTSTDGYTWGHENRTPRAWLGGAAPLGTDFVAAGGNGLRLRSVDQGRTWQDDPGYQAIHYRDVASGGGVVVAVGHNYDTTPNVGVIASTTDGIDWTERVREGATFNNVVFGNGCFIAAGPSGRVSRSPDGVVWTDLGLTGAGGASVIFTGADFVLSFDNDHLRSVDGLSWTHANGTRSVVGFFAGNYLSLDWPARIWVSSDLEQWTARFTPLGSGFTKIVTGRLR